MSDRVSNLNERKQKFLEMLLTLGSLLTIFLGFIGQESPLLPFITSFGILFVASSLFSYAMFLFHDRIVQTRGIDIVIQLFQILLSLSFSALIVFGLTDAFTGAGANNTPLTIFIVATILGLFFVTYFFIAKILGLKEIE